MKGSLFAIILFTFAACATQDVKPTRARQSWEPEQFEVVYSPAPIFGSATTLKWDGFSLVERKPHVSSTLGLWPHESWETVRYHPSQSQWTEFWATAGRLRMTQWRKAYLPSDVGETVFDGASWTFRARIGSTVIDTSGDNAGPALPNVSKTRVRGDGVQDPMHPLEEAIAKLRQDR